MSSVEISRRSFVVGSAAAAASVLTRPFRGTATAAGESGVLAGINLAGAEFGTVPGVHGTEYLYPPSADIAYYQKLGFRFIRLPFKWERLQPEPFSAFAPGEQALLSETVRDVTGRGLTLVLDPHNYAKRRLPADNWADEHLVGSDAVPAGMLYDFWARLARLFPDRGVVFGLMNEPVGLTAEAWLPIVNGTIAAIREAGAANLVLVPGVEYTGAHSWLRTGNTLMGQALDPMRTIAFDVHQYLDQRSSGTEPVAISGIIGAERIEAFQEWARAGGHKAFLGEFGSGGDPTSLSALADLCAELEANRDVWLGWAAWAGGPRWPDDNMHTLEPHADSGREREQTSVLKAFAVPVARGLPMGGSVIDLDLARGRAFGVRDAREALGVTRSETAYAARRSGLIDAFAPNAPRITDLGLLIEEARQNLFGSPQDLAAALWTTTGHTEPSRRSAPLAGTAAFDLRSDRGRCALAQAVDGLGADAFVASIHAHRASSRWLAVEGGGPSMPEATFNIESAQAGSAVDDKRAQAGYPWGWQRLAFAWQASGGEPVEVAFAPRSESLDAASSEPAGAGVTLWGPMLEAGRFATSYHPQRRSADVVRIIGRLAELLTAPESTLIIELRNLPLAASNCEILSAGAISVLKRSGSGALVTELGNARTASREPQAWCGRIKVAVAMSSADQALRIAVTGAPPIEAPFEKREFGPLVLGSGGTGALNGRVTRIVGFERSLDASELAARVA